MRRWIVLVASVAFQVGCAAAPRTEWQRMDGNSDTDATRDRRAIDIAECTTIGGAPTPGSESSFGPSRGQANDCMRARGWRRGPVSGP